MNNPRAMLALDNIGEGYKITIEQYFVLWDAHSESSIQLGKNQTLRSAAGETGKAKPGHAQEKAHIGEG